MGRMASKMLWRRLNRNGSFSYWEILLESLVVLVVGTELSLECGKAAFPSWSQSRVEPTTRLHYVELMAGIPLDRVLNPSQPIDERMQLTEMESRMGSVLLLCATAVLYLSFTAFLCVNRNWKPPMISFADKSTAEEYELFSFAVLVTFYITGAVIIYLLNLSEWWKDPLRNPLITTLLLMWILRVIRCGPRGKSESQPTKKEKASQMVNTLTSVVFGVAPCHRFVARAPGVLGKLLAIIVPVAVACVLSAGLILFGAILSLLLLSPMFTAVGLIRGIVVLFGEAAAFPGLVVVSCLLVMRCTGRMLGIWLTDSNVVWIVKKLRSARKTEDTGKDSSSEAVSVKVDANALGRAHVYKDSSSRGMKCVADGMVVCVVSSALWSLYVGGTTRNVDDADPWHIFTTLEPPHCFPTLMAGLFSPPPNTSRACWFMNHRSSPAENRAMDASFAISGLVTFIMVPTWLSVVPFAIVGLVGFILDICWFDSYYDSEEPQELTSHNSAEMVPSYGLYDLHNTMAIFPLYFVRVVLPWYALDFLPGNWYIPGITVYLVGSAVYFCCTLVKSATAWLESTLFEFLLLLSWHHQLDI